MPRQAADVKAPQVGYLTHKLAKSTGKARAFGFSENTAAVDGFVIKSSQLSASELFAIRTAFSVILVGEKHSYRRTH